VAGVFPPGKRTSRRRRLGTRPWGIGGFFSPRVGPQLRVFSGGTYLRVGPGRIRGRPVAHIQYWASAQVGYGAGIFLGFGVYSGKGLIGQLRWCRIRIRSAGRGYSLPITAFGVAFGLDLDLSPSTPRAPHRVWGSSRLRYGTEVQGGRIDGLSAQPPHDTAREPYSAARASTTRQC